MANAVTANHDPTAPDLEMSNGLTTVFLSVLLLSGSELARTDWEVMTIAWLAERDQETIGAGVVGFDVSELGWTPQSFAEQKAFLLRMIDGALTRRGWDALRYEPKEAWLLPRLAKFRNLIERFPIEACPAQPWSTGMSSNGPRADRARCPRHGVYLNGLSIHDAGCCPLCNDEG